MSIPLVKKLDLDSINTSIIAIKRLLQQAGVSEGGNTIINNNSQGGIPLGTWASFENDSAPNGEWLQGGTSFDPNTYPALAMMLGGNTIPERFDHNRPSDTELIQSGIIASMTMQYDADLLIAIGTSEANRYIMVNGEKVSGEITSSNTIEQITISVKKGDVVVCSGSNNPSEWKVYATYYKHPLFIKATPTSSDSDYEGTLNAIRQTVSKKPDWQNAIAISFSELQAGYVAPADGMVVGSFDTNSNQRFVLTVEDVVVTQGYFSSNWDEYIQVQCLVAKDNVIKTNATTVLQSFYYMSFVPWKTS